MRLILMLIVAVMALSGTAAAQGSRSFSTEPGIDRPGGDFDTWVVDGDHKEAWRCKDSCQGNPRCKAYTFVAPTSSDANGLCRLKETVPAPVASTCCTSGVRGQTGAGAATKPPPPPQTKFEGYVEAMCVPRSPSTRDIMIRLSGTIRVDVANNGALNGTFEASSKGTLTGRRGGDGKVSGELVMADGSRLPWTGEIVRARDGTLSGNGAFGVAGQGALPDSMFGPACLSAQWRVVTR